MDGKLVLVVEDNEMNMELVRDVLQAKGYRTLEATLGRGGARARAGAGARPDPPGHPAAGNRRRRPRSRACARRRPPAETTVVALTAQAMEGDRESFLAAGFDGYISKPIDVPEFIRAVAGYCDGELTAPARILVVDDIPENVRLMEAVLVPRGYTVLTATSGEEALELVERERPDLILLDVVMPGMDGYAVCQTLREGEDTGDAAGDHGHLEHRPREEEGDRGGRRRLHPEAVQPRRAARPREVAAADQALPRHDQGAGRRAPRAEPDARGAGRAAGRRARAAAAAPALPLAPDRRRDPLSGDESILQSHRRQVAVFFCDLRGYTNFADSVEPEELMGVLGEFHEVIGRLVEQFDATVGFLAGDGVELFFNDPIEIDDPALRAVRLGCALRDEMAELRPRWLKRGYELDFGVGIAFGYATLGEIGFEGRSDYAAIGAVTNLASRLCDEAAGGQILISQRTLAEVEEEVEAEEAGTLHAEGLRAAGAGVQRAAAQAVTPAGIPASSRSIARTAPIRSNGSRASAASGSASSARPARTSAVA